MVKIATYEQQTSTPDGFITSRVQADTSIGDAMQHAGAVGQDYALELQHRQNQTSAKQADIASVNQMNDLLYGEDGYFNKSGRNAVDALPGTLQKLTGVFSSQASTLKGGARELYDQQAQLRLANARADLQRYALGQHKVEEKATSIARQNLSVEQSVRMAGVDDARSEAELETAKSELANRTRDDGLGEDVVRDEIHGLTSKAYGAATEDLLLRDPTGASAQQYLNGRLSAIDPVLGAQLQTKVTAATDRSWALTTAHSLVQSGVVPSPGDASPQPAAGDTQALGAAAPAAPATKAPVLGKAAHPVADVIRDEWSKAGLDPNDGIATALYESGMRTGAVNGQSKGLFQFQDPTWQAMGGGDINDPRAQARNAAKYYKQNRDYLVSKGIAHPTAWQVYLAHQQGPRGAEVILKGNPNASAVDTLRAAGVTNPLGHIHGNLPNSMRSRAATITNGQFADYVRGQFTAKLSGGAKTAAATVGSPALGGSTRPLLPDLGALRAQARVLAGGNLQKEQLLLAAVEAEYGNAVQDRAAADQRAIDAVQPYLRPKSAGGLEARSVGDIPTAVWLALPETTKTAVANHMAEGGASEGYARVTDPITLANIRGLQGTNPGAFVALDLTKHVGKLSPGDYDQLLSQQVAMRQAKPEAEKNVVDIGRINGVSTVMLKSIGISDKRPDGAAKVARFQQKMFQSVDAWKAQNPGKAVTDETLRQLADGLLLPTQRDGWFGHSAGDPIFTVPNGQPARLYVPDKARDTIVSEYRKQKKNPKYNPTELEIQGKYREMHAYGMFK